MGSESSLTGEYKNLLNSQFKPESVPMLIVQLLPRSRRRIPRAGGSGRFATARTRALIYAQAPERGYLHEVETYGECRGAHERAKHQGTGEGSHCDAAHG